jgi:ABC-2 type transport system permease protein
MDKLLLPFVSVFKNLFLHQGIDFEKMMAIVKTKLMMDQRRTIVQFSQKQTTKETNNRVQTVLIVYALIGGFIGFGVVMIPSLLISMIIVHAYIMVMMSMTLITDFSTVLLDTTDNQVLLPKPVDGNTLFMARLLHILIYIVQFTIALAAIPIICTFFKYGLFVGLASIVTILLIVLTAVFLSYLLYLLIITFSSEKRAKDIITFMQIIMIVFFSVGFQVLPRIIDFEALFTNLTLPTASYLFPPVWMGVILQGIDDARFTTLHIAFTSLAILFPVVSIWVMNKYMAPAFSRKLAAISTDGSSTKTTTEKTALKRCISGILSVLTCRTLAARAGFELTWKLTGRDKTFKLRFYPSLGYIIVYIFIFVFQKTGSVVSTLHSLHNTNAFLWFIYSPVLIASSSILIIAFSDNYEASWIYYSAAVHRPGEIIAGSVKALFMKFFIPVFAIMLACCLYIWGATVIDDFIYGLLNMYLCCLIFALSAEHYLPFSRQPTTQQGLGNFLLVVLQLVLVASMVGIHYLLITYGVQWALLVLIPLTAFICKLVITKLHRISWTKIIPS